MAKQKVGTLYGKPIVKGGGENGNEITKNEIKLIEKDNLISLQKRGDDNKMSNITGGGSGYSDCFVPVTYNDIIEVRKYKLKSSYKEVFVYYTNKPTFVVGLTDSFGENGLMFFLLGVLCSKSPIPYFEIPDIQNLSELEDIFQQNIWIDRYVEQVYYCSGCLTFFYPFSEIIGIGSAYPYEQILKDGIFADIALKDILENSLLADFTAEDNPSITGSLVGNWGNQYPERPIYLWKVDIDKVKRLISQIPVE